MTPVRKRSSITGSVDTTYSGLRTVAEFDTTTDSLLTKVAVTSEKMSLGSVPFTLKVRRRALLLLARGATHHAATNARPFWSLALCCSQADV